MLERFKKEEGFTLIEILAAMLILSIVALAFTAYFSNALTFSKSNQNKTIMSNLARSAVVYMQKQNFERLESYFNSSSAIIVNGNASIVSDTFRTCRASSTGVCAFKDIFTTSNPEVVEAILSPSVNGIDYRIVISYQKELTKSGTDGGNLLLPITATIRPLAAGGSGPGADAVTVEGYVNAEIIR